MSSGLNAQQTSHILETGTNCWKKVHADRLSFIVDAADYFAVAKQAMAEACHAIYLIGWEFDLRARLKPGESHPSLPDELGEFLMHIAGRSESLHVHVLQWDGAMLLNLSRQILPFLRLKAARTSQVQFRLDSEHPAGACHHQKIVVVDDALAFCGGIDMTRGRWDTSAHEAGDERRRDPAGANYGPWHDVTLALDGEAARALGELARDRWKRATGKCLPVPPKSLPAWPEALPVSCHDVDVGIARTMPAHREESCTNEIEHLWKKAIETAEHTIYIENQFLSSPEIGEALKRRLREPNGPQIVIVLPRHADLLPEREVMDSARSLILDELREADREDRLRVLYPVNDRSQPVYVHAKLIVADERLLKIGSSNMSNRSMRLDSECDIAVVAEEESCSQAIGDLRNRLVGEHLGTSGDFIAAMLASNGGDLIQVIDEIGFCTAPGLRPLMPDELSPEEWSLARSNLFDPEHPRHRLKRAARFASDLALRRPLITAGLIGSVVSGAAAALWGKVRS